MQTNWVKIQSILENILSAGQYKVWIAPLIPAQEGHTLILFAQNDFVANFVRTRFFSLIEEAALAVFDSPCSVQIRAGVPTSLPHAQVDLVEPLMEAVADSTLRAQPEASMPPVTGKVAKTGKRAPSAVLPIGAESVQAASAAQVAKPRRSRKTVEADTLAKTTELDASPTPERTVGTKKVDKPAKAAKSSKTGKTAKPAKTVKRAKVDSTAGTAKIVQAAKPSKTAQATKPSKAAQATKPSKAAQAAKPSKAAQATKPSKTAQATKPSKAVRPTKVTIADKLIHADEISQSVQLVEVATLPENAHRKGEQLTVRQTETLAGQSDERCSVAISSEQQMNLFPLSERTIQSQRSELNYVAREEDTAAVEMPVHQPRPLPRSLSALQLSLPVEITPRTEFVGRNWRYDFADFIVGPCNELAYVASRSICSSAKSADMLFLSSAPGLGKTHLMQAAGKVLSDACNRTRPKVEYLTAEEFASRFFLALKGSDTDRFKARYRDVDLLLLEDVHFLQGKEKMQAELLATIKALQERGGKVICTSSFAPFELQDLDEQLRSRLSSGLFSYIDRPDAETRKRILRYKAQMQQVFLPLDVEEALVKYIHADVRRIESCLQNLILKAQFSHGNITMQMAWEVIANYASHSPVLDMDGIISHVCQCFGVTHEQLLSPRRRQDHVFARNTAFFLARKHTDLSLEAIGRLFNRRHSTVLKGITNLEEAISRQTPVGRQASNALSLIERNGNLVQQQ